MAIRFSHLVLGVALGALPLIAQADTEIHLLGEVHDNALHHELQGAYLNELAPAAVVFEMLDEAQAARITSDLLADQEALAEALSWAESGWPDFALYWPVFQAVGSARVYGAHVPRARLMSAISDGAAAGFGAGAERFHLDQALAQAEQAARERLQHEAHCEALPPEMLPGMVAAQRVRDAALAAAALQALEDTGGPVAVILGNGHARTDWGTPALITLAAPEVAMISIAHLEGEPDPSAPYDRWDVTAPAERGDPCAAFN